MAKLSNQAILGIIILIVGILLLLENTGIYDTGQFLLYIPSLFILLGVYAIFKSGFRNMGGPLILIVIFTLIQLSVLDLISPSALGNWWPLILVVIGIGIIVNHYRKPSAEFESRDEIDLMAILGGVDNTIRSAQFRGGDITAIMGGVELDLRESKIKDQPALINATVLLGGADIKVPSDWDVEIKAIPILGGVSDDRKRLSSSKEKVKPDLIVRGFVALGGIGIKE